MAELTTLARPYARAAFEFARSQSALDAWQKALTESAAVSQDSKVDGLLSSPSMTAAQKGQMFCDLFDGSLDDKQQNFIAALAQYGRLSLLPEVAHLFELYKADQEKTVDVSIASAFELSSAQETALVDMLKRKLMRDVELKTSVDANLIGGVLIKAGDMVIDGSARARLAKLREAMDV